MWEWFSAESGLCWNAHNTNGCHAFPVILVVFRCQSSTFCKVFLQNMFWNQVWGEIIPSAVLIPFRRIWKLAKIVSGEFLRPARGMLCVLWPAFCVTSCSSSQAGAMPPAARPLPGNCPGNVGKHCYHEVTRNAGQSTQRMVVVHYFPTCWSHWIHDQGWFY